ncbi:hypothetical protein FGADI_12797 [Fusarium gaditjirri]|uniref:Uncharacterized protein n=1 Tax=Fusarium gaditjirri TaxID=282569 RepID=A0A8H4WMX7_9HYPO|nr:hypothetical protein FGADI_13603 [Fusarium gaditjirri]KAF4944313.1 hypothetical protein FGADI_12797 [Fusarium gaditjirri]
MMPEITVAEMMVDGTLVTSALWPSTRLRFLKPRNSSEPVTMNVAKTGGERSDLNTTLGKAVHGEPILRTISVENLRGVKDVLQDVQISTIETGQGRVDVLKRASGVKPKRERVPLSVVYHSLDREPIQLQSVIHNSRSGLRRPFGAGSYITYPYGGPALVMCASMTVLVEVLMGFFMDMDVMPLSYAFMNMFISLTQPPHPCGNIVIDKSKFGLSLSLSTTSSTVYMSSYGMRDLTVNLTPSPRACRRSRSCACTDTGSHAIIVPSIFSSCSTIVASSTVGAEAIVACTRRSTPYWSVPEAHPQKDQKLPLNQEFPYELGHIRNQVPVQGDGRILITYMFLSTSTFVLIYTAGRVVDVRLLHQYHQVNILLRTHNIGRHHEEGPSSAKVKGKVKKEDTKIRLDDEEDEDLLKSTIDVVIAI